MVIFHQISCTFSSLRAIFVILIWPIFLFPSLSYFSLVFGSGSDQIFHCLPIWIPILFLLFIDLLFFFFLDSIFPLFAYLFLIIIIVINLLRFPPYCEHLFHEISYNYLTFIERVVFFWHYSDLFFLSLLRCCDAAFFC